MAPMNNDLQTLTQALRDFARARHLPAPKTTEVAAEAADVLLYLLQLCDKLNIDLMAAARSKLIVNGEKYPVDRARGSSQKSTDL